MQARAWLLRLSSIALALVACGCFLDRSAIQVGCETSAQCAAGQACVDGSCVRQPDAGPDAGRPDGASDGGADSGAPDSGPPDAAVDGGQDASSLPLHCSNGVIDALSESDIDCGAECAPCSACRSCTTGADCDSGMCDAVRRLCRARLTTIPTRTGARSGYVREDGAILLAHYASGAFIAAYDTSLAQQASPLGGGPPPSASWAPDPCFETGHLPFADFEAAGATVTLECGLDHARIEASASASTLFDDFSDGIKGVYSTDGVGGPGWAAIGSLGAGRASAGMCGRDASTLTGGIAYCDGPADNYANHLISYTIIEGRPGNNPFVGCAGVGASRPAITRGVWVWLGP